MSVKELGEEIKAATYNELYFKESPGAGWEAMVIFDI
jgi:SHS2 domain-containing protein